MYNKVAAVTARRILARRNITSVIVDGILDIPLNKKASGEFKTASEKGKESAVALMKSVCYKLASDYGIFINPKQMLVPHGYNVDDKTGKVFASFKVLPNPYYRKLSSDVKKLANWVGYFAGIKGKLGAKLDTCAKKVSSWCSSPYAFCGAVLKLAQENIGSGNEVDKILKDGMGDLTRGDIESLYGVIEMEKNNTQFRTPGSYSLYEEFKAGPADAEVNRNDTGQETAYKDGRYKVSGDIPGLEIGGDKSYKENRYKIGSRKKLAETAEEFKSEVGQFRDELMTMPADQAMGLVEQIVKDRPEDAKKPEDTPEETKDKEEKQEKKESIRRRVLAGDDAVTMKDIQEGLSDAVGYLAEEVPLGEAVSIMKQTTPGGGEGMPAGGDEGLHGEMPTGGEEIPAPPVGEEAPPPPPGTEEKPGEKVESLRSFLRNKAGITPEFLASSVVETLAKAGNVKALTDLGMNKEFAAKLVKEPKLASGMKIRVAKALRKSAQKGFDPVLDVYYGTSEGPIPTRSQEDTGAIPEATKVEISQETVSPQAEEKPFVAHEKVDTAGQDAVTRNAAVINLVGEMSKKGMIIDEAHKLREITALTSMPESAFKKLQAFVGSLKSGDADAMLVEGGKILNLADLAAFK